MIPCEGGVPSEEAERQSPVSTGFTGKVTLGEPLPGAGKAGVSPTGVIC